MEESVYMRTLRRLEEKGWSPDRPYGPNGEECTLIALGRSRTSQDSDESYWKLTKAVGGSVSTWNGQVAESVEDVKLLLKYADADELDMWAALYGPNAETD